MKSPAIKPKKEAPPVLYRVGKLGRATVIHRADDEETWTALTKLCALEKRNDPWSATLTQADLDLIRKVQFGGEATIL